MGLELLLQAHVNAVGEEGDEDVRFDAIFSLMEDRTDGEIAFEILERGFDFYQLEIELPQLRGIGGCEVRAQQVASFAPAHGA